MGLVQCGEIAAVFQISEPSRRCLIFKWNIRDHTKTTIGRIERGKLLVISMHTETDRKIALVALLFLLHCRVGALSNALVELVAHSFIILAG